MKIAEKFKVSPKALAWRLFNLKWIDQQILQSLEQTTIFLLLPLMFPLNPFLQTSSNCFMMQFRMDGSQSVKPQSNETVLIM